MQIHTHFYINYIIYYGLLIFCCQNVAIAILYIIHNLKSTYSFLKKGKHRNVQSMHTALRYLIILRFISIFYFRNLKITPANTDIIILQIIHYLLMRLSCPKNPFFISNIQKRTLFSNSSISKKSPFNPLTIVLFFQIICHSLFRCTYFINCFS